MRAADRRSEDRLRCPGAAAGSAAAMPTTAYPCWTKRSGTKPAQSTCPAVIPCPTPRPSKPRGRAGAPGARRGRGGGWAGPARLRRSAEELDARCSGWSTTRRRSSRASPRPSARRSGRAGDLPALVPHDHHLPPHRLPLARSSAPTPPVSARSNRARTPRRARRLGRGSCAILSVGSSSRVKGTTCCCAPLAG